MLRLMAFKDGTNSFRIWKKNPENNEKRDPYDFMQALQKISLGETLRIISHFISHKDLSRDLSREH